MKAIIKINSDTSSVLAETCKVLAPKTGSKVLGCSTLQKSSQHGGGAVDNSQCCRQKGDSNPVGLQPGSCSDCFENPEVLINGQDGVVLYQWG